MRSKIKYYDGNKNTIVQGKILERTKKGVTIDTGNDYITLFKVNIKDIQEESENENEEEFT